MFTTDAEWSLLRNPLSRPFFRLHLCFTADDIAGIQTPANFIHCYSKSTNAAFVNIALPYNLFRSLFYRFLLNHDILLSEVLEIISLLFPSHLSEIFPFL